MTEIAPIAPGMTASSRPAAQSARHIGIVVHDFSTGGTERVAIRLANAWSAERRVTIFCGSDDGPTRGLVGPNVEIVTAAPRMARDQSSRTEFGWAVAGMVLGMRPDVIVGPGNYHAPVLRAIQDRLGAWRPAIICKISNPLWRRDRSRIVQAIFSVRYRNMTRSFDRLVAMSPALATEAAIMLGRADIACINEPVLDDDLGLPLARDATGTVLCIGRLSRQKNLALALEAFARASMPRRLLILGEGDDYPLLRDRAEALGIAHRIRFTGFVADPRPYLRMADALLCSSLYEGYPAALIEALAAGVPVVTTPCSMALPEMLTDRSFGIVSEMNPTALAAALDRVLLDGRRPERGPLRELMRRHRLRASAEVWLDMLDQAAAGNPRRRHAPSRPAAGAPHARIEQQLTA